MGGRSRPTYKETLESPRPLLPTDPLSLPEECWGPKPLVKAEHRPRVRVWISTARNVRLCDAYAVAWNDRVVEVAVRFDYEDLRVVVWRSAVRQEREDARKRPRTL